MVRRSSNTRYTRISENGRVLLEVYREATDLTNQEVLDLALSHVNIKKIVKLKEERLSNL